MSQMVTILVKPPQRLACLRREINILNAIQTSFVLVTNNVVDGE